MAAKRQNSKLQETTEDDLEAELDDEVEKELREFEQLQSGLLGAAGEKGKPRTGKDVVEEKNASGSDMELDDLDQEITEARKKSKTVKKTNGTAVLDEKVPSGSIRILPDSLVEEDLMGNDLVEDSRIMEDEEEACFDVEQLVKDSRASDPLIAPSIITPNLGSPFKSAISQQSLAKQVEELTAQAQAVARSPEPLSDDNSDDPDFPSPGKRKSRSRARSKRPSKSSRSQPRESPKKKQRADKENHDKSLDHKATFRDPISNLVPKPTHHIKKASPGMLQTGIELKIAGPSRACHPVKAKYFDKTETRSDLRIWPNSDIQRNKYQPKVVMLQIPVMKSPIKCSAALDVLKHPGSKRPGSTDLPQSSLSLASPVLRNGEEDIEEEAHSADEPDDAPQAIIPTNSHAEPQYCAIERVIRRRFENSFTLDDEKLEMIGVDRPAVRCPELLEYANHYESHSWLVACNELKRFFCWPCLFFPSKLTWSVNSDENAGTEVGKEIGKHAQSPAHQESIKQMDELTTRHKSSVVKMLLTHKFADEVWSEKDRETIILKGRPQPVLEGKADTDKTNEKAAFKQFYNAVKWICGCVNTGKFYCWPCLLYGSVWCRTGSIKSLGTAISEHEREKQHMGASVELGKREFELRNKSRDDKEEDEEKTQSFITNLVELLCAEKKKINNTDFSSRDFLNTLEMMSEYNGKLQTFMDGKSQNAKVAAAQDFAGAIQESMEFFMKSGILEEMRNSNFISLIFDHSSGVSSKAILSVVARYADGSGRVHERFVKILPVGYNTPPNTLEDEFFQVITELQCRSSLVGFTYDGYLVKPVDIPQFNEKVQKLCPNAKFFHYTEHSFKRILKQTLCHVPICRKVLQKMRELANFFENNATARKGLLDIVSVTEKSDTDGIWRSQNFITTVFLYHAVMVEIMESICKAPLTCNVRTVLEASSFVNFFKDPASRFFVTLMARIFDLVEELSTQLKKEVPMEGLKAIASHTALKLQKLGRNFDGVVDSACSHLAPSCQANSREAMSVLRDQFSNVVRMVVKLVKNRVFGLEAGYFKISKVAPKLSASNSIKLDGEYLVLQSATLPSQFNSEKLSNELQFFHDSSLAGSDFSKTIARMIDYNLVHVLPELFRFLQLALTIPKMQYDRTIPSVRRISAYIEGKKEVNSADALFWMEKEFLTNLQQNPNFYRRVTDRVMLITKNNKKDF